MILFHTSQYRMRCMQNKLQKYKYMKFAKYIHRHRPKFEYLFNFVLIKIKKFEGALL